jgi:hypothetical protein
MTACAVCEEEIVLEEGEEQTWASCGIHEVHSYCENADLGCLICDPAPALPVTPPVVQTTTAATDEESEDDDGTDVYYDAEEGTPEQWAAAGLPVKDGDVFYDAESGEPEATAPLATDPGTDGTAPEDAPDPEHTAAANRVAGDVARAKAARARVATTIDGLVEQGVTEDAVLGVMDTVVPGYSTSYGVCVADDLVGYESMASWPVNPETTTYVNATCDSYVGHAAVLENTAALDAIRVVDIGTGFRQRLTETGSQNVADMALGGESYTGHNLHNLTRDLKGWASIRAEVGKVIIVRWAGEKWEVGATGAHTNDDDYKLDATIADSFVPSLVYRLAGIPTLA